MNEIITTTGRSLSTITAEIRTLTEQAQIYVLNTTIELGRRLTEAKQLLPAGESWLEYLDNEVNYSKSTAENFMRIFREYGDDQQSLFGGNSQALKKLTYTKALALLAIPREDREEFAEKVDAENLSTRELTEAIEARKKAEQEAAAAAEEAAAARELAAVAQDSAEAAGQKAKKLESEKAAAELARDKAKRELEKAQKDLDNARKAEAAAKADLENAKPEISADLMAQLRAEAEEDAAKAARREATDQVQKAQLRAAEAEARAKALEQELAEAKKASTMGSPDVAVFAQIFQQVQEDYNKLCGSIMKIRASDPEQAAKLTNAVAALLDKMGKKIKGEQ